MANYDIECKFCSEKRYNKIDGWYYDESMEFSPPYAFDRNKDDDPPYSPLHHVACQECFYDLPEKEKQDWRLIPK